MIVIHTKVQQMSSVQFTHVQQVQAFSSTRKIFCLWTGENPMSANRSMALKSIKNTGLKVIFIDRFNLNNWIVEGCQLHPAFKYLSAVHKADYLRCYLMHHYGGGYTDIKFTSASWITHFDELMSSDQLICGYQEKSFLDAARGRGMVKDIWLAINYRKLVGNGAYICKPNTVITQKWLMQINAILDKNLEILSRFPARHPRDFYHKKLNNNEISQYPLRWTEICGEVFHPLCLKYRNKIFKHLPAPDFTAPYL